MAKTGGIRQQLLKAQYTRRVEKKLQDIATAPVARKIALLQELRDCLIAPLIPSYIRDVSQTLFDDEAPVRHQTIMLLQHLFELAPEELKLVVPGLATRVDDDATNVRLAAIELLHKQAIHDAASVLPFLELFLGQLPHRDKKVLKAASLLVIELGRRSPSTVVPRLVKLLNPAKPALCQAALITLQEIAKTKPLVIGRAAQPLMRLLAQKHKGLYHPAVELLTLGANNGVKSIPRLLLKPLVDRNVNINLRQHAMQVAADIAVQYRDTFRPAIKQLGQDLGHSNWEMREAAAQLLGAIGKGRMALVKEVIPGLAQITTDSDDLVRSAGVKALELIGVSSFDSTAIQKASEALQSAQFVISSAKNFGISIGQAEKLLQDARRAFKRGDYDKCRAYAGRAEKLSSQAEKRSEDVRDTIQTAKRTIQSIKRKGVDVKSSLKVLEQAEKLLKRRRFKDAKSRAEDAARDARQQSEGAVPDLVISGNLEQALLPDKWNRLPITLKNLGNAAAWEVTLKFSEGFALRGSTTLENIDAGDKEVVDIQLYPKSKGLVPLAVEVIYHSFDGNYHSTRKQDIVEVGENPEFEPRDLFVSEVGATLVPGGPEATDTLPTTAAPTTPSVSRFADHRTYFVVCDNCGTRIPSDFRICGRCGHHLNRPELAQTRSTCGNCHATLTPGQKFCGQCGNTVTAQATACTRCGTPLLPDQKFCGKCGTTVSVGPPA